MKRALAVQRLRGNIRQAIISARPGLIEGLCQRGYRSPSLPEDRALEQAIGQMRGKGGADTDFWALGFQDSADGIEASNAASMLCVIDRRKALSTFSKALDDRKAHVRKAAAEGIADIALSAESVKERDKALDIIASAANDGNAEAAAEIESTLMRFFDSHEESDALAKLAESALAALVASSHISTITTVTLGAAQMMLGNFVGGGICFAGGMLLSRIAKRSAGGRI